MKRTKKLTPEVHAKAEGFIANGYQRLLTFEVPGGGFSWFGNAPANKILTAYGLMEFSDMSQVHDVDPQADRADAAVAGRRSSRRTEAGSRTPTSSTKAPPTATTPTCCGLRRTSAGRWRIRAIKGPAVEKAKEYVAAAPEREGGRVHAGGGGQFRGGLREGPRVHAPGDAHAAGCAHGKRRAGLVDGGRDRRLRQAARAPPWRPRGWRCRRC